MTDKPHLSVSRIKLLMEDWACALEYYWRYEMGIQAPANAAMSLGSSIDSALCDNLKQKVGTGADLDPIAVGEMFAAAFDARRYETVYGPEDDHDRMRLEGKAMVERYMKDQMPNLLPTDVDQIQRRFRISISNYPFDLVGVLDYNGPIRIGEETVSAVIDWKARGKRMSEDELRTDIQLTAYWLAHVQLHGAAPAVMRFDQIIRPSDTWPTPKVNKDGSLSKNQPRGPFVEPALVERTEADLNKFWFKFARACEVITKGTFLPDGPAWKCKPMDGGKGCYHWDSCMGKIAMGGTL